MMLYFINFYSYGHNFTRIITDLSFAFGSTFFASVGFKFMGSVCSITGIILYLVLTLFLAFKTFKSKPFNLLFPLTFLIIYFISIVLTFAYLNSFA